MLLLFEFAMDQKQLLAREWIAITLIAGIIITLSLTAWLPQHRIEKTISSYKKSFKAE
jgi:hypothetical protein